MMCVRKTGQPISVPHKRSPNRAATLLPARRTSIRTPPPATAPQRAESRAGGEPSHLRHTERSASQVRKPINQLTCWTRF